MRRCRSPDLPRCVRASSLSWALIPPSRLLVVDFIRSGLSTLVAKDVLPPQPAALSKAGKSPDGNKPSTEWPSPTRTASTNTSKKSSAHKQLDTLNVPDLYSYQRSAKRISTGRTGKIDMYMPGKVIGEAKSLGVPLDDAHAPPRR